MMITEKNTRRLLCLAASAILVASLTAEASLKIYKKKGNVTRKTSSGMKIVQRRDQVSSKDVINIPDHGSLEILNTDNRRIYSSVSTGKMTVGKLIKEASNDAASLTRQTNTTIISTALANGGKKPGVYVGVGLSYHETDGVSNGNLVLPKGVSLLSYLMNCSSEDEYRSEEDVVLVDIERVRGENKDDDDSFIFSMFNTLNMPLYVNVIDQVPDDGKIRFYFDENPVVSPRGRTKIDQYRFMLPEEPDGYIVVASPEKFSIEDVRHLLDASYSPSQDFFLSLIHK